MNELIEQHYRENFQKVCSYMRFRAGDQWSAEDVVQEAYYRAIKYFDNYDSAYDFKHWFNRILVNALADFKRNEKGHIADEFEEESAEGIACSQFTEHTLRQIYELIDTKQAPYKEILTLHIKFSYSPKDIAALTGATPNVAYKTIAKFREEIKGLYL